MCRERVNEYFLSQKLNRIEVPCDLFAIADGVGYLSSVRKFNCYINRTLQPHESNFPVKKAAPRPPESDILQEKMHWIISFLTGSVTAALSCGDLSQTWTWFSIDTHCFDNSEKGENDERRKLF